MKRCDTLLIKHSDIIDKTLSFVDSDSRAFLAALTLGQLRHFVEHVILKIYCEDNCVDLDDGWANITQAVKYVYSHNQYSFIRRFHHNHLQKSVSHKMQDEDTSETLMLLYLEPLIQIKDFVLTRYGIEVLKNLNRFPLDLDNTFLNYYKKIQEVVFKTNVLHFYETDFYYVHKKKPIWINGKLMYELTLGPVNDYASKFDRFVAFSKRNVFENYAIEASMVDSEVDYFGINIPI